MQTVPLRMGRLLWATDCYRARAAAIVRLGWVWEPLGSWCPPETRRAWNCLNLHVAATIMIGPVIRYQGGVPMRFARPGLALVAVLLLVGSIQLTRTDSTAASEHILTFQEVGGSGIVGIASLTAVGSDVEVVVEVTGLVDADTFASGAYDSTSVNCVGGLLPPFSDTYPGTAGGVTFTVPGVSVSDISSVSVRTGDMDLLACAERAAAAATPTPTATPTATVTTPATPAPAPAEVPPTGGGPASSSSFLWLALVAGGLIALSGGLVLARQLRRIR